MFAETAGQVERDMNKIVGRGETTEFPPLTDAELQQMNVLLVVSGRDGGLNAENTKILNDLIFRYVKNGGKDPRTNILPPKEDEATPKSGSILDFSSPLNTIVKSVFLLSLSPMFHGANFYFISVGCSGAILYSLYKSITNR